MNAALDANDVERAYPRLDTWRRVRWELTNGGTITTFDSDFTRRCRLSAPPNTSPALPGLGSDIGVGADGSVWLIGTDPVGAVSIASGESVGPRTSRLVGTNPVGADADLAVHTWNGTNWDGVDGGGVRIAVGPDGTPWLVNSFGQIFHRQGNSVGAATPGLDLQRRHLVYVHDLVPERDAGPVHDRDNGRLRPARPEAGRLRLQRLVHGRPFPLDQRRPVHRQHRGHRWEPPAGEHRGEKQLAEMATGFNPFGPPPVDPWMSLFVAGLLVMGAYCLLPTALAVYDWHTKSRSTEVNYGQTHVQWFIVVPLLVCSFLLGAILWDLSEHVLATMTYGELFLGACRHWPFPLSVVFISLWGLAFCSIENDDRSDRRPQAARRTAAHRQLRAEPRRIARSRAAHAAQRIVHPVAAYAGSDYEYCDASGATTRSAT